MDQPTRLPRVQQPSKASWRRAADELLIDAIFGSTLAIRRDAHFVPVPVRSPPPRRLFCRD